MATTYQVGLEFKAGNFSALTALESRLQGLERSLAGGVGGREPFKPIDEGAKRAVGSVERLRGAFSGIQGALAGLGAGLFLRDLAQTGQAAANASRQLKFLSDEYGEYAAAQASVVRIQKQLGVSSIDATKGIANLYAALRPTGTSLRDIESAFVGFSKAARRSGASTAEVSASALQLKQALGSGVLQGDELRSLREQAPVLAQAIAKAMGVSVGALKELGSQGKITTDIVIKALKDLEQGSAPPLTAIDRLNVAFTELKTSIASGLGPATSAAVGALAGLLEGFNKLPPAIQGPIKDVLAFGVAVLGAVTVLGAIVTIAPAVIAGFTAIGAVAGVAWVAITGPVGLAVAGLALLTKAAYDLIPPFRNFVNDYPAKFIAFWESLRSQGVAAIERLKGSWQAFVSFFTGVMNAIRKAAEFAFGGIIELMKPLAPVAAAVGNAMSNAFSSAFNFIQENWRQAVENMINYSSPLTAILKGLGIDVGAAFTGATSAGAPTSGLKLRTSNADYPSAGPVGSANASPLIGTAVGGGSSTGGGSASAKKSDPLKLAGGSINERIIFDSLVKRGYNKPQIAAIMGSLEQESSFSPYAKEPAPGTGLGLFQWSFDRRKKVPAFTNDLRTDIERQLDLFEKELAGPEAKAGRTLRGATTLKQAALGMKQFERYGIAGGRYRSMDKFMGRISGSETGEGASSAFVDGADEMARLAKEQEDRNKTGLELANRRLDVNKLDLEIMREADPFERARLEFAKSMQQLVEDTADAKANITDKTALAAIDAAAGVKEEEYKYDLLVKQNIALREQAELTGQIYDIKKAPGFNTAAFGGGLDLLGSDDPYKVNMDARRAELEKLIDPLNQVSTAADKMGAAFSDAFTGLITGSLTAQQALAGMFQSIASHFLDMAGKMLAQQGAASIMGLFSGALGGAASGGLFSGAGVGFPAGGGYGFNIGPSMLRAKGGPVGAGKAYVVGEEGPELFIPGSSGGIIPNSDTISTIQDAAAGEDGADGYDAIGSARSAMRGSLAGLRGIDGRDGVMGAAQAAMARSANNTSNNSQTATIERLAIAASANNDQPIKFEYISMGNVDYVTKEQAMAMSKQASKDAQGSILKRMKNSVSLPGIR